MVLIFYHPFTVTHVLFSRFGTNGILSSSVESLTPMKNFPTAITALPRRVSENMDPAQKMSCCPQCMENYEQELGKLEGQEFEKSSSEVKSEVSRSSLPQWLKNAKALDGDVKTTDQSQVCFNCVYKFGRPYHIELLNHIFVTIYVFTDQGSRTDLEAEASRFTKEME